MDEADLYLVRVWHEAPGFRASVRRVDDERVHLFGDAEQLARFLALPVSDPPSALGPTQSQPGGNSP